MPVELDHIAIALSSLDKGLEVYGGLLGLVHHGSEEIPQQKVKAAMMMAGASRIELVSPASDESPIAKFISKYGEGLHHIALRVENIDRALDNLKKAGARLIDDKPRHGMGGSKIAFIHPSAANGVLIELVERP